MSDVGMEEQTSTVVMGAVDFIHVASGLATSGVGRVVEALVSNRAVASLVEKVIDPAIAFRPSSERTAAVDRFTIVVGRSFRVQDGEVTEISPGAIIRGCNLEEVKEFQRQRLQSLLDRVDNH